MKIKVFMLCFLFALGSIGFADIRDCVCIVKPEYGKKITGFMEEAEGELSRSGYFDIAEYFRGAAKGIFGSGFFIKEKGNVYVLTNYHVVAYASAVTVEIENAEGEITKIDGCPIVAINEQLDLAAAEVPAGKVKSFLTFAESEPPEGTDVWSAGYPALGKKPLWQLGKGSVTNAKARLPKEIDPKKSYFIQHSAQIDSGNSGGPLLQKDSKSPNGYTVVGINSSSAIFRQAANFSIPISSIKIFLSERVFASQKNIEVSVETALKEFTDILTHFEIKNEEEKHEEESRRLRKLALFISEDEAINNGLDIYMETLRKAPKRFRSEILSATVFGNPIDGVRTAIAYTLYTSLNPEKNNYKPEKEPSITTLKKDGKNYEFVLTESEGKNKKLFTVWKNTFATWQLDGFNFGSEAKASAENPGKTDKKSGKKNDKKANAGVYIDEMPSRFRIKLSYTGLKNKEDGWRSGGMAGLFYSFKYFELGGQIIIGKPRSVVKPFLSKPSKIAVGVEPEFRIHLPINVKEEVYIIPNAFGGAGMLFPDIDIFMQYGAGLEFIPAAFNTLSVEAGCILRSYLTGVKQTEAGLLLSFSFRF
ncbi:serine protease [Treponema pedis]|uniref:S1C family serine protease n=1 Tax=Treponema pedis TaxID=409322 RepID=UPI003133DA15